jgi:phosphonate transport system substrate-binding protein
MLLATAGLVATGCPVPAVGDPAEPEILTMAMVPAEDVLGMIVAFEPARQFLERELGVEIEMFKATSYGAVIEAMRADKVDIAFYGPFSFVLAAERAGARAIVAGACADGHLDVYHSIMITHRDSGLGSIDDVKARAGELTISFVDPASTSGHLIPRGFMEAIGIDVDTHFKEIIFAGGHDASILAVGVQKVDFGATWEGPFERAIEAGLIRPEDVLVIWRSDPIPTSPIAVRGDLDEALIRRIQQAFLDMPQKAPDTFAQLEAVWHENVGYVAVTCADYEFIRQVAIGLGKL